MLDAADGHTVEGDHRLATIHVDHAALVGMHADLVFRQQVGKRMSVELQVTCAAGDEVAPHLLTHLMRGEVVGGVATAGARRVVPGGALPVGRAGRAAAACGSPR